MPDAFVWREWLIVTHDIRLLTTEIIYNENYFSIHFKHIIYSSIASVDLPQRISTLFNEKLYVTNIFSFLNG